MPLPRTPPDQMTFWEHLQELRVRLIRCLVIVAVAFALAYSFPFGLQDHVPLLEGLPPFRFLLWQWVQQPLLEAMARQTGQTAASLHPWAFTDLSEPFFSLMRLSLWAGAFLSAPLLFQQIWAFIRPGLYERERRMAVPFVAATSFMFLLGVLFAYFQAFRFLGDILFREAAAAGLRANLHIGSYLDLFLYTLLVAGIAFELPVLVYFLARFRLVTAGGMLRYWRHATLLIVFVSALMTPGDIWVSTILFSVILLGLYFVSLLVAWLAARKP